MNDTKCGTPWHTKCGTKNVAHECTHNVAHECTQNVAHECTQNVAYKRESKHTLCYIQHTHTHISRNIYASTNKCRLSIMSELLKWLQAHIVGPTGLSIMPELLKWLRAHIVLD
jgi:hypothetical protein